MMKCKSVRWHDRQLEHYGKAVEGRTDPPRYILFRDKYLNPPPLYIIDIGCAGGDITNDLKKRGYEVVGVDYPEVIEKTKKKYPYLNFVSCDVNDMPLMQDEFLERADWIYASEICEHITHDFDFLSSCFECLKNGGKIFVTVPRHAEKWEAHLRFYPEESLKNLLWAAGFEIFAVEKTFASLIAIGEKK